MADYATMYAPTANRIRSLWYKKPTIISETNRTQSPAAFVVDAGANFARLTVLASGGQGNAWGGGACLARTVCPVTPGETLTVQCGDTGTASGANDSWVKRGVTPLVYSDHGRGVGTQGLASNSIGDVTRSGNPQHVTSAPYGGGEAGNDVGDFGAIGLGAYGFRGDLTAAATYGGGGQNIPVYDTFGNFTGYYAMAAGCGVVLIELFSSNPGY